MQERRTAAIKLVVKSQHDQSLLTSNIAKPYVDNIFSTLRKEKKTNIRSSSSMLPQCFLTLLVWLMKCEQLLLFKRSNSSANPQCLLDSVVRLYCVKKRGADNNRGNFWVWLITVKTTQHWLKYLKWQSLGTYFYTLHSDHKWSELIYRFIHYHHYKWYFWGSVMVFKKSCQLYWSFWSASPTKSNDIKRKTLLKIQL